MKGLKYTKNILQREGDKVFDSSEDMSNECPPYMVANPPWQSAVRFFKN